MLRILIVDADTPEVATPAADGSSFDVGENYANALRACCVDLQIEIVAPYKGEPLPPLEGFDGAVFTGSGVEWSTDDARAAPLADAMRQIFAKGLPTLGSCNGLQLAASVLGGSSDASPNGREDGMAKDIHLTEAGRAHPFLAGRRDGYAVPCVHRDEVVRLPDGAVLLACNAHSQVQAFAYEQDGIRFWGVQYHPELDPVRLAAGLHRRGRLSAEVARDLADVERDPQAAARLGVPADQMTPEIRMTELKNWLASLSGDNLALRGKVCR